MAFTDQFVCTQVRFKFWNGKKIYTVQYSPGIRMWFVFDEETSENCLWKYELNKREAAICNHAEASEKLDLYFESIGSEFYTVNY